jgi:hypothetical protein
MTYSQIAWLPLAGGLTLLGLIASWLAWRRRGAAAGLRGVAWSLLPLAAYLTGVIELLWRFGSAIASFATSFVFSLRVWSGVAVAGLALVLFVVSGGLRSRAARKKAATQPQPAAGPAPVARAAKPAAVTGGKATHPPADDDFSDVEQILRRRGIR